MTPQQKERYTRQISLNEVGDRGQQLLAQSSVLVVGVGGLGSPIATLLVTSGVGRVGIVDFDTVSLSNLPRQTLYTTDDIGLPKVECAARRLRCMNPEVEVVCYNQKFSEESAAEIAKGYDVVVDGCDNMATRYLIDQLSQRVGIPYVYGAIRGFEGQVSVFNYMGAGGYSQLFPIENVTPATPPPPVMSTTPALIGAIQANEVMKILIGYADILSGRLLTLDSRNYTFNIFEI
ncbi:MAG: HesA/MoeB/ThiF family protein [Rikenellaceae bacterium]